jgi:hypothetical protein
VDLQPYLQEVRKSFEECLNKDRDGVLLAWKQLEEALVRQFSEADEARTRGKIGSTKTLNEFYAALETLKKAVKQHSGTPAHRLPDDPERDREIYRMRNAGRGYPQIVRQLRQMNPSWKVTEKVAERADKRYRERVRNLWARLFQETFSHPPHKGR